MKIKHMDPAKNNWMRFSKYISIFHGDIPMFVFSPNSVATLEVLTVGVKAWCSFEVVSYVRDVFDNPDSKNAPSSSVFEGSLARNSAPGGLSRSFFVAGRSMW